MPFTPDNTVSFNQVEEKVITIRDEKVILDSDVAKLYGVETKEINQAVKNNPDKFPVGYILLTTTEDKSELVKNFDRFNKLKHSSVLPSAFTEKGLYMLATILKSDKATQTTIAIVEAFAKIRELSRAVVQLSNEADELTQKSLMQASLFHRFWNGNIRSFAIDFVQGIFTRMIHRGGNRHR